MSCFKRLFLLAFALPFLGWTQIYFKDKTAELNLEYSAGNTPLGNGVTFNDYNNDGWDDLTVNRQDGDRLLFFRNINGTFTEDILIIPTIDYQTRQVNWVDIDNDGDKDLFVSSDTSGNRLFENTGNMNLIDITVSAGLPIANMYTFGSSWGDFNNDGFPDLFVSNRDEVSFAIPNFLYRNNGDSTFTDVTVQAGLSTQAQSSFCAAFFDFNNDGFQDIFVANDRMIYPNFLYKNNGDGTFTDIGASSGTGLYMNAMSATVGDFNNDGWFDLYVTNTSEGNSLFMNNGDETFSDMAASSGTAFNAYGWGAVFLDADHDMDLDLYVSGLYNTIDISLKPFAFYRNENDLTFSEPSTTGFELDDRPSFSNAIGDYNNDGKFDLIVSNSDNADLYFWKNESSSNFNWLKLRLDGVSSNKNGIGSRIEIGVNGLKQYRYTGCGEGYLSQNSDSEIFGLGTYATVDYIKVNWLSGIQDTWYNITANQSLVLTEGTATLHTEDEIYRGVLIAPNPSRYSFRIQSPNPIKNLEIFNILGQKIYEKAYNFKSEIVVISEAWDPGIYLAIIKTSNGISNHRIVKR
ncbi:MAG: VCBS repeat-containing protein [Bacteroidia bacterium]|nr:VCBS repeat-containing protein [Bacteroidia bacterium]NNK72732.1 T9SS type A sorting domain-containing protein [Flavobacteriaceae bacterium]